jgi:hypothetical protein
VTDKLLKHLKDEPEPIERLRPNLPGEVTTLVRKLLAKKPEGRCQTPAEVAAVLSSVIHQGHGTPWVARDSNETVVEASTIGVDSGGDSDDSTLVHLAQDAEPAIQGALPKRSQPRTRERGWLLLSVSGACLAFLGMLVLVLLLLHEVVSSG